MSLVPFCTEAAMNASAASLLLLAAAGHELDERLRAVATWNGATPAIAPEVVADCLIRQLGIDRACSM